MKRFGPIFIFCFFISFFYPAEAKRDQPLYWDIEKLAQMKNNLEKDPDSQYIIQRANTFILQPNKAVTIDKRLNLGPNEHYYCSMGPYRWADPDNPNSFILRDGVINPDYLYYDVGKLAEMVSRCTYFSKAFYLTHDLKYYDAFISQIKEWFLNEETYMEPNFDYSQVKENNIGSSSGMIDAYQFNALLESVRLVNMTKRIDRKTYNGLKRWINSFAVWSVAKYGDYFKKVNNNISLAFDVTMIDLFVFSGERKKAKIIAKDFTKTRIINQISEDGKQEVELKRTRAYYYSIYNLSHILDYCYMVSIWDKNYYQKYGGRVDKAFEFLLSYVDQPDTFPYQQITDWEECERMLIIENERRLKLR